MKCPCIVEPHQIQGLDFINIYPVVQWLIKESVKLRSEKAARLKLFAVGQFHNHFSLKTDEVERQKKENIRRMVREIEDLYPAKRQYKRKQNAEPEDEYRRVRLTLLEYGVKSVVRSAGRQSEKSLDATKDDLGESIEEDDEVCTLAE
jgi:hypothetical protein